MSARPQFTLAFNLQATNEQRREMFALYEKAFGAKSSRRERRPAEAISTS